MKEPKDLTPTLFGYIVAYLLPGLSALVVLALIFDPIANLLRSFANAQSTVGLFFFVLLICLLLGMQLTACRWFLFEKLIYKSLSLTATELSALRSADLAASFRLLIDEAYRYHQFFGAQVFVIPALLVGVLYRFSLGWRGWLSAGFVCLVLEVITCMTAAEGWRRYVERSRAFLTEVNHGNRIQEGREKKGGSQEGRKEESGKEEVVVARERSSAIKATRLIGACRIIRD